MSIYEMSDETSELLEFLSNLKDYIEDFYFELCPQLQNHKEMAMCIDRFVYNYLKYGIVRVYADVPDISYTDNENELRYLKNCKRMFTQGEEACAKMCTFSELDYETQSVFSRLTKIFSNLNQCCEKSINACHNLSEDDSEETQHPIVLTSIQTY